MYESIKKNLKNFKIRFANENDADLIFDFIKKLAIYEKRLSQVVATKADIKKVLFKRKIAEAIIGEYEGKPVSFAIFLYNFSTFIGKTGIYIEDLYVNPEIRCKGIGTLMFAFLAKIAIDRKCGTLEWSVLNWNEPSIKFYKKIGAEPKSEWTIYRITDHVLEQLARSKSPSKSLSVSDAVTCKSLDSNKKPIGITNTFDAGVKGIYLFLIIHNFTTKDKITVKWNYLDTNAVVNTTDFTSPQDLDANYLGFAISLDQGFPAGKYNAEIYLNDKLTQTVNFSVK